jgi:ribosomal protein S6--L-glutamate ligase
MCVLCTERTTGQPGRPRVGFLLNRPSTDGVGSVFPEVMRQLAERGASVGAIYPDETLVEVGGVDVAHDLYVLKAKTDFAFSLAAALDAAGAAILNPYPVSAICRDRIVLGRLLRGAGVPLPQTWAAVRPMDFRSLLGDGPIILKPNHGSQGRGVRVVRDADELANLTADGPLVAQRYHPPAGRDRKLYRIGASVFGVKRVWPARTYEDKLGETFLVGDDLREVVMRCGDALGIGLYGVDVVETDDGPYVVDLSSMPGFKGVPDGPLLLAEYIWDAAGRARAGASDLGAPRSTVGVE